MTPAQIAASLTPAQVWAMKALTRRRGLTMAQIGEEMRKRPGAATAGGYYARDLKRCTTCDGRAELAKWEEPNAL